MTQIIAVHSFRGGTGKSNVTANTAALLARRGHRVAVIDTDIQSPGIHVLFGFSGQSLPDHTLNEFLAGSASIDDVATDVGPRVPDLGEGSLHLIAASISPGDISTVLRDGYDVERLNEALIRLGEDLALDHLLVDTHPGLNEETLLTVAICDVLAVLLRPDQQDYQGTAVTLDIARRLGVPQTMLLLNKVYAEADPDHVRRIVAEAYQTPVVAVMPLSEDVAANASAGLFVLSHPDHPWSRQVLEFADALPA